MLLSPPSPTFEISAFTTPVSSFSAQSISIQNQLFSTEDFFQNFQAISPLERLNFLLESSEQTISLSFKYLYESSFSRDGVTILLQLISVQMLSWIVITQQFPINIKASRLINRLLRYIPISLLNFEEKYDPDLFISSLSTAQMQNEETDTSNFKHFPQTIPLFVLLQHPEHRVVTNIFEGVHLLLVRHDKKIRKTPYLFSLFFDTLIPQINRALNDFKVSHMPAVLAVATDLVIHNVPIGNFDLSRASFILGFVSSSNPNPGKASYQAALFFIAASSQLSGSHILPMILPNIENSIKNVMEFGAYKTKVAVLRLVKVLISLGPEFLGVRGILENPSGFTLSAAAELLIGNDALLGLTLLTDCLRGGDDEELRQLVIDVLDKDDGTGWENLEELGISEDPMVAAHAQTLFRLLGNHSI